MAVAAAPLSASSDYPSYVNAAISAAGSSWLKNEQLMAVLQHFREVPGGAVNGVAPQLPDGGRLYLVDKRQCKAYRTDGHVWEKKRDGKTLKENHEKLRVGLDYMLNCYYSYVQQAAGEEEPLNRRIYWLLENEDLVLVHYLHSPRKAKTRGDRKRARSAAAAAAVPKAAKKARAASSGGPGSEQGPRKGAKRQRASSPAVSADAETLTFTTTTSAQSEQWVVGQEELDELPTPQSRPAEEAQQAAPMSPAVGNGEEEEEDLLLSFGTIGSGSFDPWIHGSMHEGEASAQQAPEPAAAAARCLDRNTSWRRREEEMAARARAPVRLISHDWSLPEPCTPDCCTLAEPAASGLGDHQDRMGGGASGSAAQAAAAGPLRTHGSAGLEFWESLRPAGMPAAQLAGSQDVLGLEDSLGLAWHDSFMQGGGNEGLGLAGPESSLDPATWAALTSSLEEEGGAGPAHGEVPKSGNALWHLASDRVRALWRLKAFLAERANTGQWHPMAKVHCHWDHKHDEGPSQAAPALWAAPSTCHALPAHR